MNGTVWMILLSNDTTKSSAVYQTGYLVVSFIQFHWSVYQTNDLVVSFIQFHWSVYQTDDLVVTFLMELYEWYY
jgi:hypothetical protein